MINNPVIKKLGYGTTLGTTGGLPKSVDTAHYRCSFTYLRRTTPMLPFL